MVCDNDRCKHLDVIMHNTITTYNFLMDFLIALLIYFQKKHCLNKKNFEVVQGIHNGIQPQKNWRQFIKMGFNYI